MTFDESVALLAHALPEVFVKMLSIEPVLGTPYESKSPLSQSELTALIALAGQERGSVSMHTTRDQAAALTATLLGISPDQITDADEIRDAMGEIINMIAGDVKLSLANHSIAVEISLPTVVMGSEISVSVQARRSVVAPFETPFGRILVELVREQPA